MKVALFGFQTWGYRVLDHLLGSKHEVALVVTHPSSDHAYESIWSDSVEDLARAKGVPVLVKNRPDPEVAQAVADADLMVACNWRTWIPPEVFTAPRLGSLNVHDSLLPRYAGFAPLNWAIINGETEVGVTAHVMDERLDRGDIVLQWSVPVGPRDTATDMFHATLEMMGPITLEAMDHLEQGTGPRTRRTRPRPPSSTSVRWRTASSTGRGRRPTSSTSSGPSRTPTRTPTPSPTAAVCGCCRHRSALDAAAARPGGSSPGPPTATA